MSCRRRDCRKYFSVKADTVMAGSPVTLHKWVYAIYITSIKGVSNMKSGILEALKRPLGLCNNESEKHSQIEVMKFYCLEQLKMMRLTLAD